jgi:hypothetical protein
MTGLAMHLHQFVCRSVITAVHSVAIWTYNIHYMITSDSVFWHVMVVKFFKNQRHPQNLVSLFLLCVYLGHLQSVCDT